MSIFQKNVSVKRQVKPSVDLADYLDYAYNSGLVGEEQNFLTILLVLANPHLNAIIEGPSGAAKSSIANVAMNILSGLIYEMSPASPKGDLYDPDMHMAPILYVPELQKIALSGEFAIEMLKNFGEGRGFTYRPARGGREIEDRRVSPIDIPCKNFITTFASQNKLRDILDVELSRRLIRLYTDITMSANKGVVVDKARRVAKKFIKRQTVVVLSDLEKRMRDVRYATMRTYIVIPYMETLSNVLDTSFISSRTIISQLIELINSVTAFYAHSRPVDKDGDIISQPIDAYLISLIALPSLVEQSAQLPSLGRRILEVFDLVSIDEYSEIYTRERRGRLDQDIVDLNIKSLPIGIIQEKLMDAGYSIDIKSINTMCQQLSESGYLQIDEGFSGKYRKYIRVKGIPSKSINIDWPRIISETEAYQGFAPITKGINPFNRQSIDVKAIIKSPIGIINMDKPLQPKLDKFIQK